MCIACTLHPETRMSLRGATTWALSFRAIKRSPARHPSCGLLQLGISHSVLSVQVGLGGLPRRLPADAAVGRHHGGGRAADTVQRAGGSCDAGSGRSDIAGDPDAADRSGSCNMTGMGGGPRLRGGSERDVCCDDFLWKSRVEYGDLVTV